MSATQAAALYTGGENVPDIAVRFAVSTRTVYRWLQSAGVREPLKREAPDWTRVDALLADGVPATWIVEETGINYEAIMSRAHHIDGHRENVREWMSIWPTIANSTILYDLHRQIAPRPMKEMLRHRAAVA